MGSGSSYGGGDIGDVGVGGISWRDFRLNFCVSRARGPRFSFVDEGKIMAEDVLRIAPGAVTLARRKWVAESPSAS